MANKYVNLFKLVDSYHRARGVDLSEEFHRELVRYAIVESFRLAYKNFDFSYPNAIDELGSVSKK